MPRRVGVVSRCRSKSATARDVVVSTDLKLATRVCWSMGGCRDDDATGVDLTDAAAEVADVVVVAGRLALEDDEGALLLGVAAEADEDVDDLTARRSGRVAAALAGG